ncbi:MAG: methionyl-tRNA formyltransferase [Anaerolineaceae bacterium]
MMKNSIVFMGSPEFSVPILQGLADSFQVVGVVTQPDRPSGRGRVLTPPPVKVLANKLGFPIIQPQKLRLPEAFEQLVSWKPDAIVVAAFGQILRQNVLDLPPFGCINVHASYLPRWRGAAPIQAAIFNGDEYSGISIMRMDAGIDTGPVYRQEKELISSDDTFDTLSLRLSKLGVKTLLECLPMIFGGKLTAKEQLGEATYVSMLNKEDGLLDWTKPAIELERLVRAYIDWPGAYTFWKELPLKVRKVKIVESSGMTTGMHFLNQGYPAVQTGEDALCLLEVQPAGKKWMSGKDFINGNLDWVGENTGG